LYLSSESEIQPDKTNYHQANLRLDMVIKIYLMEIFNYQVSFRLNIIINFT